MSFTLSPSQPDLLRHRRLPYSGAMLLRSGNSQPHLDDMSSENLVFLRRSLAAFIFVAVIFFVFNSVYSFYFVSDSFNGSRSYPLSLFPFFDDKFYQGSEEYKLDKVLNAAANKDKTVILTTLNEAWAMPNSIIDLFLESFRIGYQTRELLNHLVIVALDDKAFRRCVSIHRHCYALLTEGMDFSKEAYFMTPDYLKMMWRRIDFLQSVLEMGYNFVFTDADVMWFRDPFPHFFPDADFQIACDHFLGNPYSVHNRPNGGFNYVKSNNRSIEFYKFWYLSQERYPGYHDQDVLNFIKRSPFISDIGLSMRFLDTTYFGGFCEPSKDLNKVCTMHANCCLGVNSKLHDLKILLQDWRRFMSLPLSMKYSEVYSWRVPDNCSLDALNKADSPIPMESGISEEEESER